ncbi:MAG: hypothetical protein KY439_00240 [Actinobacteria bacterium]|nr:hypothetical protein [Actinomycetota bacterium]
MESRGSSPAFAVGPEEAPELAGLFDRPGPFVTVCLPTQPDIDNAAQRSLQQWRPVRDELTEAGAPASALDAIEAMVPDAHHDGPSLVAVADESGVLVTRSGSESPSPPLWYYAPLPVVGPLVTWWQTSLPHVLVVADRIGADVTAIAPGGRSSTDTVGGDEGPHLRKSHPGGWSQRRYQERAENNWESNAKAVAERTASVADYIGARAVLVAGDVRALQFLREHLPERLVPLVRELEGARGADGGDESLLEDARKQMATIAAEDTVAVLEKLREEKGQADRAADGLAATIEALNAAAVDVLLVHDDPNDERGAWYAPDAALVALDAETLEGYGVDGPAKGRLVDALIRTAFRTGARVRTVPSTVVTDGAGALLRFTT